jgi:hypothetical protein
MGNAYDNASLVLTPNGYKASKIYSAKPTDGSGDLAFSRASTALRRNSAGLWEEVANNVPRLQYPVGGGCPSWLFEPQATNINTQSIDFTTWANGGVTVTPNFAPSIFQSYLATKLTFASGSFVFISCATSVNTAVSVYYKNIDFAVGEILSIALGGGTSAVANITPFNNTVVGTTNCTATITLDSNGFYKVEILTTATNTNIQFASNAAKSVLVSYYGVEASTTSTSPIITAGSAVTRLADAASKTGISSLIGQTEGTIFFDIIIGGSLNDGVVRGIGGISDGTNANRIEFYRFNNTLYYDNTAGGVGQFSDVVYTITSFN